MIPVIRLLPIEGTDRNKPEVKPQSSNAIGSVPPGLITVAGQQLTLGMKISPENNETLH